MNDIIFENVNVTTQTFVARTNLKCVDLEKAFDAIGRAVAADKNDFIKRCTYKEKSVISARADNSSPISVSASPPLSRRKRVAKSPDVSETTTRDSETSEIENYYILPRHEIDYGASTYKRKTPRRKNFLNCVTVELRDIQLDIQKINVKIFNNGVLQLTGCKRIDNAIDSIVAIFSAVDESSSSSDKFLPETIIFKIVSVMRNVDFEIGSKINRLALGAYVTRHTNYSVPPMTSSYMGVKIKIPITYAGDVPITVCEYPSRSRRVVLSKDDPDFGEAEGPVAKKARFVSVSVFQNGKVLMSGMDESVQKRCFAWFKDFIHSVRDQVLVDAKTYSFFDDD